MVRIAEWKSDESIHVERAQVCLSFRPRNRSWRQRSQRTNDAVRNCIASVPEAYGPVTEKQVTFTGERKEAKAIDELWQDAVSRRKITMKQRADLFPASD